MEAYLDKGLQDVKTDVSVSAEATELSNDGDSNNTQSHVSHKCGIAIVAYDARYLLR